MALHDLTMGFLVIPSLWCLQAPSYRRAYPVCLGFFLADDAKEAVKIGVNGILVSNHGARQLDGVPATVSPDANMLQ